MARYIANFIADKKGKDVLLLDIQQLALFADFFVICSGTSSRQLKALVNSIKEEMKNNLTILPHHIEGEPESGWILLDYGDIIVHIFDPAQRNYYDLEELWHDGKALLRLQ